MEHPRIWVPLTQDRIPRESDQNFDIDKIPIFWIKKIAHMEKLCRFLIPDFNLVMDPNGRPWYVPFWEWKV